MRKPGCAPEGHGEESRAWIHSVTLGRDAGSGVCRAFGIEAGNKALEQVRTAVLLSREGDRPSSGFTAENLSLKTRLYDSASFKLI